MLPVATRCTWCEQQHVCAWLTPTRSLHCCLLCAAMPCTGRLPVGSCWPCLRACVPAAAACFTTRFSTAPRYELVCCLGRLRSPVLTPSIPGWWLQSQLTPRLSRDHHLSSRATPSSRHERRHRSDKTVSADSASAFANRTPHSTSHPDLFASNVHQFQRCVCCVYCVGFSMVVTTWTSPVWIW